jgi:hypothetical protein
MGFDLLFVRATNHEYFLDAGIGKEFERIFEERGIGEGQQALQLWSEQRTRKSREGTRPVAARE